MANTEKCAEQLDKHEDFQVLRRLSIPEYYIEVDGEETIYLGAFLDLETTGLDTSASKVIEVGIVPFEYTKSGQIIRVLHDQIISSLQDPGEPISPEVIRLTGISDEMVSGKSIDDEAVKSLLERTNLIIAHNASFDRPIAERYWSICQKRPWACSLKDISWKDEGIASAKLDYLGWKVGGFFFDGHRAAEDCLAGVEILTQQLPVSKKTAFEILRKNAATKTFQIWATNAPFDKKDLLKSRGYRWNVGDNKSSKKAWWTAVPEQDKDEELEWLIAEIYGRKVDIPTSPVTAMARYSDRI
jgi:DNA polymerase III subunit epsilon